MEDLMDDAQPIEEVEKAVTTKSNMKDSDKHMSQAVP
jgi:hypothetical protein